MRDRRLRWVAWCLATVGTLLSGDSSEAVDFKKGDEVEVQVRGRWTPAVVVDVERRGFVIVEWEEATRFRRGRYKDDFVLFAYEKGALDRARNWKDASGQFQIVAALLGLDGDKVVLRKPDKSEIKVPIDALSDTDKRYLDRLTSKAGEAALRKAQAPPVERFSTSVTVNTSFANLGGGTITPDPIPSYMEMQQGGAAFPTAGHGDRLSAVLPIGGADGWLLAAIENTERNTNMPTRLLWASTKKNEVVQWQQLPPAETLLDYHPPSHRLLTFSEQENPDDHWHKKLCLTVWEVLPTDAEVTGVVRWDVSADRDQPSDQWARLIDGNTVLHRYKKHEYVAWDLARKQMLYRIGQESFNAPMPAISGGRKYLFLPAKDQVRIVDTTTGQLVSTLTGASDISAVGLTDDCRRLAALGNSKIAVWDLTAPNAAPETYSAEILGNASMLRWVGNDWLMAEIFGGKFVLFSLEHRATIWSYRFDMSAVRDFRGGRRLREIVDNHLVYAATVRAGTQRGLAVGAVELPGPRVREVDANFDRESIVLVKPGTPIRVEVDAGAFSGHVREALEQKVREVGWKLDPNASIVLEGTMKKGDPQTTTYRFASRPDETVTVTPHLASAEIKIGTKVAWRQSTGSGAPSMVFLKEGESAQSHIDKSNKPNPGFFERLKLFPEIIDPDKREGMGYTQVTNRGLVLP